ncbi:hypothetical protein LZ31DRAFT_165960 [Colletotrichum somersetense]|nr:hypothetical protein LZ31DRAFT_165960 [Colletotrichum somersetense]
MGPAAGDGVVLRPFRICSTAAYGGVSARPQGILRGASTTSAGLYARSCMVFLTRASPNWKQLRGCLQVLEAVLALPAAPLHLLCLPQTMIPHIPWPSLPPALHTCFSWMPRRVHLKMHAEQTNRVYQPLSTQWLQCRPRFLFSSPPLRVNRPKGPEHGPALLSTIIGI